MTTTWIVEYPLTWVRGGVRTPGRIAIGMPRLTPDRDDGEAIVPVALDGIQPVSLIHGINTLSALRTVFGYLEKRLSDLVVSGVHVELPHEHDKEAATRHLLNLFR